MFVGRKQEIEKLNAFYEKKGSGVAAVYGQLGIGKTSLLREFARDKRTVFFTAYDTCDNEELRLLEVAIAAADHKTGREMDDNGRDFKEEREMDGVKKPEKQTLENLLDRITYLAKEGDLLFVLDHYPSFVKADASYERVFFDYVTKIWKNLPVKVILCGDQYLSMDKCVCGKKAIYRSALAESLELKGLAFEDAKAFFPKASVGEAVFLYGMTGGIPGLLEHVQESMAATIQEIFLNFQNPWSCLPEKILGGELRELSYYNRLLCCLAAGNNRVNQISSEVHKPKDVVVPYLNTLMSIGVVKKETAITEETNRKKTRYSIVNSNVAFYYRFIAAKMDLYYNRDVEGLCQNIMDNIQEFLHPVFVDICREFLQRESEKHAMPFSIERTGNWWKNDDELGTTEGFDLVMLGKCQGKSATVFVECFYDNEPVEISCLKGLIEKTKQLRREGDVFYVVFSKSGFHENALTVASAIKNIMLVNAEEVVK